MKEIYLHEYTLTLMEKPKERRGIIAIRVEVVTESVEADWNAAEDALKFLDNSLNIQHRILLNGYEQ